MLSEPVTGVTPHTATLHGTLTLNGLACENYWFRWGTSTEYTKATSIEPCGNLSFGQPAAALFGLSPGTTYHYRLSVESKAPSFRQMRAEDREFRTADWSPTVTTGGSDHIEVVEESGRATLHGTINPNGFSTTYKFEYGENGFEHTIQGSGALTGSSPQEVSTVIKGLKEARTYKYRLAATNEGNGTQVTNEGGVKELTTPDWRPVTTTQAASEVKAHHALLNGTVNPKGFAATCLFEYGKSIAYGSQVPCASPPGSGQVPVPVSASLSGLEPLTTYHFRLVATTVEGSVSGNDEIFTTGASPAAVTGDATGVDLTKATLNGTVNPEGLATTYHFEYDTKEFKANEAPHGVKVPGSDESAGSGETAVAVKYTVSGLTAHTSYHFRIVATSGDGTTYGADHFFYTGSWSAQSTPSPEPVISDSFAGVSCESSTECMAVGNDGGTNLAFGVLWDGSEWTTSFKENSGFTYRGMSCVDEGVCALVGRNSEGLPSAESDIWPLGFRQRQSVPVPSGATNAVLQDVSCGPEGACTAVGSYTKEGREQTYAVRKSGSGWSVQTTANPPSGRAKLFDVSCVSSSSCTAVGSQEGKTLAERWNGSSWSITSTPNPSNATEIVFTSVSCSSDTACTAVGSYFTEGGSQVPLAERWNGSSWSIQATANPTDLKGRAILTDVSCSGSTTCTAVGTYTAESPTEKALIESWNGGGWTVQSPASLEGKGSYLTSVSCTAVNSCTAAGFSSGNGLRTLVERFE